MRHGGKNNQVEPARRPDSSIKDTFSDVPTPALLNGMSRNAQEHNKQIELKYGLAYRE